MAKARRSRGKAPSISKSAAKVATTAELVPLELRLRRLRRLEAKRQRQVDLAQARVAVTAAEMAALLDAVTSWMNRSGSGPVASASGAANARPVAAKPETGAPRRLMLRRLIGA